jgi:hypothetical protein
MERKKYTNVALKMWVIRKRVGKIIRRLRIGFQRRRNFRELEQCGGEKLLLNS